VTTHQRRPFVTSWMLLIPRLNGGDSALFTRDS
jgi:hypothetical protein